MRAVALKAASLEDAPLLKGESSPPCQFLLFISLLPEFAQKSINILILKNQAHFSLFQTIESIILVRPLQPYKVQTEALIVSLSSLWTRSSSGTQVSTSRG